MFQQTLQLHFLQFKIYYSAITILLVYSFSVSIFVGK